MRFLFFIFLLTGVGQAQAQVPHADALLCIDDEFGNVLEIFANKHIVGRLRVAQNGFGSLKPGLYHIDLGGQYGEQNYQAKVHESPMTQLTVSFWQKTSLPGLPIEKITVWTYGHMSYFRCYGNSY